MTRQEQKDARREQILDAGLDLFVRNGYHGTTTKDIAEAIGVSQGLMFHHFKSKDDLYIELLADINKKTKDMSGLPEPTQANALEIIEMIIASVLQSFRSNERSAKYFILVAQAKMCTRLTEEIRSAASGIYDMNLFETLIANGQTNGVIREGNPAAMGGLLYSVIQGAAQTYVCFPEVPLPEVEWIINILRRPQS